MRVNNFYLLEDLLYYELGGVHMSITLLTVTNLVVFLQY